MSPRRAENPVNIFQGQNFDLFIQLSQGGTPVPGILSSDVVMRWWRPGDTSVAVRPILPEEWVELGDGDYVLKLPGTDVSRTGILFIRLTGSLFDIHEEEFMVEPAPLSFLASANYCIVSGNTLDLSGRMLSGKEVVFRPVDAPNAVGPSIVNFERIITYTDALGNFSVRLLRGAKALVEIKEAGLRGQIDVPDQSTALLLDLLPPIP